METILITKDPKFAKYAEESGIDIIMVDLEILGKKERQGHLNTLISEHSIEDVTEVKKILKKSKLLVRINPLNDNSKTEIDNVINVGADIVMLPMFKTAKEVEEFVSYVNNRALVNLLLETPQALVRIDEILDIEGIDEIHVGLNDLHLGMGLNFMFELLSGGIVEYLSKKIVTKGITFGFGGVGRLKEDLPLDPKLILSEHYRLNSTRVILSRDFHGNAKTFDDIRDKIDLKLEVEKLNKYMDYLSTLTKEDLLNNQTTLKNNVNEIRGK
ncbi:HpcH/HpaI aldolase [Methanococcus vannielii SB]|jgi:hypothetical protein|uniref:HpcH/HpaI aldolase n=1 Tax=Methanococcus vannielii (strain ATCC 35089 / DSM 1224 / JCM 13029 / OCM 148 / SB) TaxID=406327 RepID=A6UP93_METVS|nr:aldolase/citrate lyase family protein [Methanococcus vannielii]ABR54315.1 HpcH/HpaI aldolase [Methanococcus vannielii SB]